MLTNLLFLSFLIAQDDTAATESNPAQEIHDAWSKSLLKAPALHFSARAEWRVMNEAGEVAMIAEVYEFESKMFQPRSEEENEAWGARGFFDYTTNGVQVKTNGDQELERKWGLNFLADGKKILAINPDNPKQAMNAGEEWGNAISLASSTNPLMSFFPLHCWAGMISDLDFLLDPEIVKIVEDSESHPGELGIEVVGNSMVLWIDREYRPTSLILHSDDGRLLGAPSDAFPSLDAVPANTIEMTITSWELVEKPNPGDYKVEIPEGAKVDPKIK